MLEALTTLAPSDVVLIVCMFPAIWFLVSYGIGSPWYRDPLGVVILLYAFAVVALLGLIIYAIVFGQPVEEPLRFLVSLMLFSALIAKTVFLHRERRIGRSAEDLTNKMKETPSDSQ